MSRTAWLGTVVVGGFVWISTAQARAQTNVWLGKSPAWEDARNWSGGLVPAAEAAAAAPGAAPISPLADVSDESARRLLAGKTVALVPAGCPHAPFVTGSAHLAGTLIIATGATVMAEGTLGVAPGKLLIEDGGSLWLGVAMNKEPASKVLDVGLKIEGPVPAGAMPPVEPAPVPSNRASTVTSVLNVVGPLPAHTNDLVNIAPFAVIRTVPYMTLAGRLVDPDPELRTMPSPEAGTPANAVRYDFRFEKPQTIVGVQWAVVAGPWAILADTTGHGEYDRLVRMDLQGRLTNPGGVWHSRSWLHNWFASPVRAYGIRIVCLLQPIPNNCLYDVRILAPRRSANFAAAKLARGVPALEAGERFDVAPPPTEQQFLKGFHIEPWMFNVPGWIKMNPRPPLAETAAFTNFVAGVKRMHGTVVNMWPPTTFETRGPGEYESDLLWPSQYDRHSVNENLLKLIAEAFHSQGIKLSVMQRNAYPRKPEEFPKTSTSSLDAPGIGRPMREYWAGVAGEQAASGVDGVGVGFDEQAAWGLVLSLKQKDPVTRKAFADRFQRPFPEEPADTEAFRKWVVFAYEQFASFLQGASSAAKAANPKVFVKTPIHMSLGSLWNDRIKVGIAEDIVGHTADLDFVRANGYEDAANIGHYIAAASTVRMIGANRTRGADLLLNCPWANDPAKCPGYYLDFTPAYMAGSPISHIMHGGKMPLYWRYNFTFYGGYDRYVEQAYSILDTMAAWGAKGARVPRNIAVLKSRASEDWWQIRQRYGKDGNPMDQTRGYLQEKWLLEFLFAGGYPFELYYLDQPQDWKDLSQFRLVILPFPYSLSKEAAAGIEDAVNKGSKLLVFDRQGETDEWGEPYAKPLLGDLIAQGKASFIGDDLPSVGHDPAVLGRVRQTVDSLLGDRKSLDLNAYGNDVEANILEKSGQEKFISLINWTDRPVAVDVGLPGLPAGTYTVWQRDLSECRRMTLAGKAAIDADHLRQFRVPLAPWEIRILYVQRYALR